MKVKKQYNQIEEIDNMVIINFDDKSIGFEKTDWNIFKDNLMIEFSERTWLLDKWIEVPKMEKIDIKDLTISMKYCLWNKHQPVYNDFTSPVLNIKELLKKCKWTCV